MLSVNQLKFKVKNKTLIDELTLNVTPGSFYALLGRKGSGKTTLLRLCSGLLEPQSGNIYINGMDVSKRENKKNIASMWVQQLRFSIATAKKHAKVLWCLRHTRGHIFIAVLHFNQTSL